MGKVGICSSIEKGGSNSRALSENEMAYGNSQSHIQAREKREKGKTQDVKEERGGGGGGFFIHWIDLLSRGGWNNYSTLNIYVEIFGLVSL